MRDLLALRDLEPPMGDTAGRPTFATTRAVWTNARTGEVGAPPRRIVHVRVLNLHGAATLGRLGLRRAPGFHKCGSFADLDYVTAFTVRVWDGAAWRAVLDVADAPDPGEATHWIDLPHVTASAVAIEVRRCDGDGWWPSWNLVSGAFRLDAAPGTPLPAPAPRDERLLRAAARGGDLGRSLSDADDSLTDVDGVRGRVDELLGRVDGVRGDVDGLLGDVDGVRGRVDGMRADVDGSPADVDGMRAGFDGGEHRLRAGRVAVGFARSRAALTTFALDADDRFGGVDGASSAPNLLRTAPGVVFQGPTLAPVGAAPVLATARRGAAAGAAEALPDGMRYTLDAGGQRYTLTWTLGADGALALHAVREADAEARAHVSSAWTLALDPRVSPAHVVAALWTETGADGVARSREAETGLVPAPLWLDVPRMGRLRVEADGDVLLRADVHRSDDRTTLEIKVGERPQPEGDYVLPAGRFEATVRFRLDDLGVPLRADAPSSVRRAVERCALTALTYRPDTGTLTNNGASMHCPLCMDAWAATATRLPDVLPGVRADEVLRTSLERWLHGAPGYASGTLVQRGRRHAVEDEYLMTSAAALLGLADYLDARAATDPDGARVWLAAHAGPIADALRAMRGRDVDGDGLVESVYRTGISGTQQWSTNWFDVLSFGYKDAFSNALLYPALVRLAARLPALGAPDLARIDGDGCDTLDAWAARLRAAFVPAFFNPETGWLAGWRCRAGRLHDHAFLFVSGAAVTGGLLDDDLARDVMTRLHAEYVRTPLPDASLGLPGNLWSVPDADRSDILQGYPLGYYQNGGLTHSQARHFVGALYRVGMTAEADALLERLCDGLAEARVYGGVRSGLDWRYHDGRPCGYEGLLTDQFAVVGLALERWGAP